MQDMMKAYSMNGMVSPDMFGDEQQTLVLNANNDLVQFILENPEGENTNMVCEQLYDLALLAHKPLDAEAMTRFITRSNKILSLLTNP